MKDNIDDLQGLWKNNQKTIENTEIQADQIIALAKKNKRNSFNQHLVTITILTLVLIGISSFFIYVANFRQTLSHIGVVLMTGSLSIRILIELFSLRISKQINLTESALKNSDATLRFYRFRKQIHGPTTIIILILYTIGFYLLTPEFSLYFSFKMMLLIDLSYLIGAIPVGLSIRNGIRKEMYHLDELLRLKNKLME